jgi:hypothetical protein
MIAAGFTFAQGVPSDLHEIIDVAITAFGPNPNQQYTFGDVPASEIHDFYYALLGERYDTADCESFKVVEDATGYFLPLIPPQFIYDDFSLCKLLGGFSILC